jgi:hypothetical protein
MKKGLIVSMVTARSGLLKLLRDPHVSALSVSIGTLQSSISDMAIGTKTVWSPGENNIEIIIIELASSCSTKALGYEKRMGLVPSFFSVHINRGIIGEQEPTCFFFLLASFYLALLPKRISACAFSISLF